MKISGFFYGKIFLVMIRVFCGTQQEAARNNSGRLWKNGNGQRSRNLRRSPLWNVGNYAVVLRRVPYGALPDIAGACGAFAA